MVYKLSIKMEDTYVRMGTGSYRFIRDLLDNYIRINNMYSKSEIIFKIERVE